MTGALRLVRQDNDNELEVVTRMVLSRLIATGHAARPMTAKLCQALAYYADAGSSRTGTRKCASVPLGPWPVGESALRALGVTRHALADVLQEREDAVGP